MKQIFLIILLIQCSLLNGKTQSPDGIHCSFFSIIVSDLDKSSGWYQDVLGYEVLNTFISDERGIGQVNLQNQGNAIELIELSSALDPAKTIEDYTAKTKLLGIFKIGFNVNNFDSWMQHLQKQKVKFSGNVVIDPVTGNQMVIILDPDGNRVQIFESR